MGFTFAIVAACRPHAGAAPSGGGTDISLIIAIVAFTILMVSLAPMINYVIDVRVHNGVNVFRRRRVLRSGVAADATVLSCTVLEKSTGSKFTSAHSIVYDVHAPAGGESFRGKGIEVLSFSEWSNNRLNNGQTVQVKVDLKDRLIVLVRADPKKIEQAKEQKRREEEARLLRGDPSS